jgi:hypothetical protein
MKALTFALAALFFSGTAASADWQFTKWGMTPEQVQKASKGAALETPATERAAKTPINGLQVPLLSMPYTSGDLQLNALFYFDKQRRLARVELEGAKRAEQDLRTKYGPPDEVGSSSLLKWYRDKDEIQFEPVFGRIDYQPRTTANNSGL